MDQSMTVDELRERHAGEWLLIEYESLDDELRVTRGRLLAHSPDRDEVYRALLDAKGKKVALEYAGTVPEDLAFAL